MAELEAFSHYIFFLFFMGRIMMQGIWLLFVLLICLRNFEAWKEWSGSLEDEKFADGIVEKFSY